MDWSKVNIPGLVSMLIFYALILVIGLVAAWWKTRKGISTKGQEAIIVAGRDIGLLVGSFTMIATWVGGGYINGTAEAVFTSGLVWAQAPVGYALSLFIGGLLFARTMRSRNYVTMLDPFQEKYGRIVGGFMYFPALCGELLWTAAILNALGSAVSVIMGIDFKISLIVSACIAVFYTFLGGLYSVAYTDVVQLLCIALGLTLAIPFAWTNSDVHMEKLGWTNLTELNSLKVYNLTVDYDWLGTVPSDQMALYVDSFLLLIFGGIPWQVYFQRVLSAKSELKAQLLSFTGALGCLLMSVPPILIGIIAKYANWSPETAQLLSKNSQMVLPRVIQDLTPTPVAFFGLGAVSAAVMSSSDSSILSASSMFAHNIYKQIFRPKASDIEVIWILRLSILVCGAVAAAIGILVKSVYQLWFLSSDLVYVLLFPQLFAVIFIGFTNSYGVLTGYLTGLVFRLIIGESSLNWPGATFPDWYPAKTVAMLANLAMTILVSAFTHFLFKQLKLNRKFDFLRCFSEKRSKQRLDWQQLYEPAGRKQRVSPSYDESSIYGKPIRSVYSTDF